MPMKSGFPCGSAPPGDEPEKEENMISIEKRVHELYWDRDVNCARTALIVLGELFGVDVQPQTLQAAIGMHGAGGYRAQCGLAEGALMFMGIYFSQRGKAAGEIASLCARFAVQFVAAFSSLDCRDLRPGGFKPDDAPHRCEALSSRAIRFAHSFVLAVSHEEKN